MLLGIYVVCLVGIVLSAIPDIWGPLRARDTPWQTTLRIRALPAAAMLVMIVSCLVPLPHNLRELPYALAFTLLFFAARVFSSHIAKVGPARRAAWQARRR